ncbi:MAG: alpha/beta hydrolase [Rickettsiales bacterium]|nr:alpha/beta hydrolase [Rickettsiales bacterium]|tara:strand:+ start:602 stop:1429 length:828 start_codon:yes stop_codon:yes gene_type:complete
MSNADPTDLHIETFGPSECAEAVPVLLIQGVGMMGRAWQPQVDALRDQFRLAYYDNRGVGNSPGRPGNIQQMGADALEVMDRLEWGVAHLAGHSLGGVIAQQAALLAPERVRSLALLCSFAEGRVVFTPSLGSAWANIKTVIGTGQMRRRAFFELVSDPAIAAEEAEIAVLERVFGRPLHRLPSATIAQVLALSRADFRLQLPGLQIPSLVVSAAEDKVAPPAQGRVLAELLKGRYLQLPGGHACPVQQAQQLNQQLRLFWSAPEEFLRRGRASA